MTVLDDARRLARYTGLEVEDVCFVCDSHEAHRPDCSWLALPRIVRALEAAKHLSAVVSRERFRHTEYVGETVDGRGTYSWCQSCDTSWPCNWAEAAVKNAALLTILRGETEP